MAASANDKFTYVGEPGTATTLSAPGYTIGNGNITVASTTNWPTSTGVIFAIDTAEVVNGEEVRVEGSYCVFAGTVASATSITNLTRLAGTAQNYSAGALTRVYIPSSSQWVERLVEGLTAEHSQLDGSHTDITPDSITVAGHIDVNDSSTAIRDSSDNELVKFAKTASAVNEVTVTNAATANAPQISATGGDTNIDLKLTPKGTGRVVLNGAGAPVSDSGDRSFTTSSTSYVDPTTSTTVTAVVGTSGMLLVNYSAQITTPTTAATGGSINIVASGANTISAPIEHVITLITPSAANTVAVLGRSIVLTGLNAGSTVIKIQVKAETSGTAGFRRFHLNAVPL